MGRGRLEKLECMFAFALWDDSGEELFLARDRIGIKPLYYYLDDQRIVFGSEIKAILACQEVPRALNHAGLANYITFGHSTAPDTIYGGIKKLLPGHFLQCSAQGARLSKYS